jgi:hypothetical protein
MGEHVTSECPTVPRPLQAHFRVAAKRELFRLLIDAVIEAPSASSFWSYKQLETVAVRYLA